MADAPMKPKPGSLRDRIAAFEKDTAAASSVPRPPPTRPKPGHISWKPAPPSPSASSGPESDIIQRHGAMSVNDAKESIGVSGGLKERMAALQGKAAFGGMEVGAPALGARPMKRPPLVVPSPSLEDECEELPKQPTHEMEHAKDTIDREESSKPLVLDEKDDKDVVLSEEDQNEETKERERRAAIAARMARLGGARIGMAPPILGQKPEKPQPTDASEVKVTEVPTTSLSTSSLEDQAKTATALSTIDILPGDNMDAHTDVTPQPECEESSSESRPVVGKSDADLCPTADSINIIALTDDSLESSGSHLQFSSLPSSSKSDIPLKAPSDEQFIMTHLGSSQLSLSSSHSSLQSVPLPVMPRRPQGPPRHKGSSRSMQSDTKTEETGTGATVERSVEDTTDTSPTAGMKVPERAFSDDVTGNAEESQSQSPEAAVNTTIEPAFSDDVTGNAEKSQPKSPDAPVIIAPVEPSTSTDTPIQTGVHPPHIVSGHTGGPGATCFPSLQSDSEAEILTPGTLETVTTFDTKVSPATTAIAERSFSDVHKEPVTNATQVQQPGMPADIEHNSSDFINPVIECFKNAEDIEDTKEIKEDTVGVVEDQFELV